MNNEERIMDKIKKLLRLGRSSNPHEAALALQRAMELAQANGIRLASIDPDDEVGGIRHKERAEARLHYEKRLAIGIIQEFFSVRIVRGWNNLKIVGRAPDTRSPNMPMSTLSGPADYAWPLGQKMKLPQDAASPSISAGPLSSDSWKAYGKISTS